MPLRCVVSITFIVRPQSHLSKDYPRIWNHSRAYELQLNQIIRHRDEWIISPGYLLYASFSGLFEIPVKKFFRPTRCTTLSGSKCGNRWPAQEIKKTIKLKYSYTNGRLCSKCKCVLWRLGSFIVAQLFFSSSYLCNSHCGTPILVCIFVVLLLSLHQLASSFERNWSLFFREKQISFVLIISARPYI